MVKEVAGDGRRFSEVFREQFIPFNTRRLVFTQSGEDRERLEAALSDLKGNYPDWDGRSLLFRDVRIIGDPIDVLLVPRDCPSLETGQVSGVEEKPNEGEGYLSVAYYDTGRLWQDLILANSREDALKIAQHLSRDEGRIRIEVSELTPDEYMEEAANMIRSGIRLSPSLIRFGNLCELEREVNLRKRKK